MTPHQNRFEVSRARRYLEIPHSRCRRCTTTRREPSPPPARPLGAHGAVSLRPWVTIVLPSAGFSPSVTLVATRRVAPSRKAERPLERLQQFRQCLIGVPVRAQPAGQGVTLAPSLGPKQPKQPRPIEGQRALQPARVTGPRQRSLPPRRGRPFRELCTLDIPSEWQRRAGGARAVQRITSSNWKRSIGHPLSS